MSEPNVDSLSFRQALLKSERFRILVVLVCAGLMFILRTIRTVMLQSREDLNLWLLACLLIFLFFGYEALRLRAVNRAMQTGQDLSTVAWIGSTVVETSIPAVATAFLTSAAIEPAYRPLANPATLAFFVFIILSTLRLNPRACRLSGLVAAVTYLAAAVYLGWRPPLSGGTSVLSPPKAVVGYAMALVICGFVAGAVAGEGRKYVDAALREAEMRRQVERMEHDLKVARSIQQSLLPNVTPQIAGFEIAGWNQPADETGGDYFDFQLLPSGQLVVALADVTGHGLGPALLAAVCRAYARSNFTMGNELLTTMKRINASLAEDLTEGRFVTFVAAICSPGSSRVELLSAGQGPLFVYLLREDRFDQMGAQGLPLGILPTLISDSSQKLDLYPGDLLVLATDGFFEWANAKDQQFGTERLQEVVRASRHSAPKDIISALYEAVLQFSGGTKQQDDLTAVIIKRR